MVRGTSSAGPRRLSSRTSSPRRELLTRLRRSGAGEDSCWAASGRKANTSGGLWCEEPVWLANCRRRSCSGRACGSQAISTATSRQRSTCSAAHRRSEGFWVSIINTLAAGMPRPASAGRCGRCGQPISTSGPVLTAWRRAGNSKRHSCSPGWACRISVRLPCGQPPPGNCASSCACPLPSVCNSVVPSSLARQRAAKEVWCNAAMVNAVHALSARPHGHGRAPAPGPDRRRGRACRPPLPSARPGLRTGTRARRE